MKIVTLSAACLLVLLASAVGCKQAVSMHAAPHEGGDAVAGADPTREWDLRFDEWRNETPSGQVTRIRRGEYTVVQGRSLPEYLSIRLGDEAALRFVLIPPGHIEENGVRLEVSRPFYMLATPLSNGQAYELLRMSGWSGGIYEDFDAFGKRVFELYLGLDPDDVLGEHQEHWMAHLSDRGRPFVLSTSQTLDDVALLTHRLSTRTHLTVRAPSIAEWLLGMRGGASTTYWWGDSWDDRPTNIAGVSEDGGIEAVAATAAGAVNPYGLIQMIGNVEEFVFPNDEERRLLRRYFGHSAVRALERPYDTPRYHLVSHSFLTFGGSVRDDERGLARSVRLERRLGGQFPGWQFPSGRLIGLRPVIEISDGGS